MSCVENSLAAQQLTVYRSTKRILSEVGIKVEAGELIALLGANGAGKSTLLSVLSSEDDGLVLDDDAKVTINGESIHQMSLEELAKKRAVLPQISSLSFELSVLDILEMGLYPFSGLSQQDQKQIIAKAIQLGDIDPLRKKSYLQLSGGEKQRVQFARVLVQLLAMRQLSDEALYFLLDEPTASLDPKYQQFLLQKLKELSSEGIGILIILHDVNLAAFYSDKLLLLADQKIICCSEPIEALTEANIETLYGVRGRALSHPFYPEKCMVVWY
ncbi:Hemin import ATP-binding protein HmuV [Oligella sp. MSHR50489EDL]